jgi:rhamnogalacturonan endolyase
VIVTFQIFALILTSISVHKSNGDITSLDFNGLQLQDSSKFTQLSSGLGSAAVTSTVDNNIAVVTIQTSTIVGYFPNYIPRSCSNYQGRCQTHYYIVRSGENTLYIGTFASAEPEVGELRFIARLNKANLPNGTPEAEVDGKWI